MVVVRKNISVQKGEAVLFDEIRYFFYITNRRELTQEEVVGLANQRSGERHRATRGQCDAHAGG